MTNHSLDPVRISGGMYDRASLKDVPEAEWVDADGGAAGAGSYLAVPKYRAGSLVVIDHGVKRGRVVYHVPASGRPGVAVPAQFQGVRIDGLLDRSATRFRLLRDALAWMLRVNDAADLPTDRQPTRDEIQSVADLIVQDGARP